MNDIRINPNDQKIIADTYTYLIAESDKEVRIFSKLLLTIYTPVTSGLLFLSTSLAFNNILERNSFLVIVITSILIVLSALLENLGYALISKSSAEFYTRHIRKTGKHLNTPFGGKKWQNNLVEAQVYIMTFLLVCNLLSVIYFIFTRTAGK